MSFSSLEESPVQKPAGANGRALLALFILLLLIPIGFVLGGQASAFAGAGLTYAPFVLLAVLAYLGRRHDLAKALTLLWLLVLFGGMALASVGLAMISYVDMNALASGAADLDAELVTALGSVIGILVLSALIGILGFVPTVRRGVSRLIPIDPDSFVHTVALVATMTLLLMGFAPLLVLGFPPALSENMLEMLRQGETSVTSGLLSLVYSLLWAIPTAIFAVGYGIRRSFGQTLQRLGLIWPSLGQILLGVIVALVLVVGVNALELVLNRVWEAMGWPRTDAEAFSELLSFAFSPLGAVLVGISAGLGEELAIRGVLQPRLGIVLSNLFFTSLHAFQYNWDSLLVVFLAGIVFGVVRKYTNTSTSAITHGVYNFTLIMMAVYEIQLFP